MTDNPIQTVGDLREALDGVPDDVPLTAVYFGDPSVGIWDATYGVIGCKQKYDGEDAWCELELAE